MSESIKLFEKTAKAIKCRNCGTGMNELKPHIHQTRSMYKMEDKSYLCKSHKCLKQHFNKSLKSYENEGTNYTQDEQEDIRLLRACGWNDMLKKKYGLDK
tara:strand:+ start:357 stop:656 length:300 start_codon:yes stop_codon:yes gene_type:complete